MQRAIVLALALPWLACFVPGDLADSGGIGGSGIYQGEITALGSIVVNDTHWEVGSASILVDGIPQGPSSLVVGLIATVEGSRDANGVLGTATSVETDDAIEGPIAQIAVVDADTKEITVLDQKILIDRTSTVFDDMTAGFDFDGVAVDQIIEVHGFRAADGSILATRVEFEGVFVPGGMPPTELKGTVSNLDTMAGSFTIGSISIDYDPSGVLTDLSDVPSGVIAVGDFVEVHGELVTPSAISANKIETEGPISGDADELEIEGLVSEFNGLASFLVAGQPVDASGMTVSFEPNDPAIVEDGARVEVEGPLVGGVLQAKKVKLRAGEARIHAAVASDLDVDPAAGVVVLLGIPVKITAGTQLKDERDGVPGFGLEDVVSGDFLLVKGVDDGMGGVAAAELERKGDEDLVLRGPVDAFDSTGSTVTVIGVEVPVGPATQFESFPGVTEAEFFAFLMANPGAVIKIADSVDGDQSAIDIADKVENES